MLFNYANCNFMLEIFARCDDLGIFFIFVNVVYYIRRDGVYEEAIGDFSHFSTREKNMTVFRIIFMATKCLVEGNLANGISIRGTR